MEPAASGKWLQLSATGIMPGGRQAPQMAPVGFWLP